MSFANGLFGPVEVRDSGRSRQLLLNGQVQGSSFLQPNASEVSLDLSYSDPGPVSQSAYALGWLIAGALNPTGSALMVGLGSGAGAIQLLYCFPGIDLTVVEIDPVIVEMALKGFPLLEYYLNRGQLNIEIGDAKDYLVNDTDVWDFACLDAYTGDQDVKLDYFDQVVDRADFLYVNVIDTLNGPILQKAAKLLTAADRPPKEVFKMVSFGYAGRFGGRSNWIMTTQSIDWQVLLAYEPFSGLTGPTVEMVRRSWNHALSVPLSAVI